jgi:hypothetical protein
VVESGLFQSISDLDDESSLYFLKKDNELLSIMFPVILDQNIVESPHISLSEITGKNM